MTDEAQNGGRFAGKIRELFGIDRRSLVLYRIGLGCLLFADVVKRSLALEAHYTDRGVMPREALRTIVPDPFIFRAHLWSGELWVEGLIFVAAALLALMVLVGWHTRIATILSVWLLQSVHWRNPMVCHTGDTFLALCAFWAIFLPFGRHASLDRRRKPDAAVLPRQVLTMGTAAILLQIALFYFFAGLDKHAHETWRAGEGVSWFAKLDLYTTPIGAMLEHWPGLCRFATYFTLALELGGPLLFFSPLWTPWIRTVLVFLFIGFHIGIHLVVYIGLFEITSIVAVLLFLPGAFWDFLERRLAWVRRFGAAVARSAANPPLYRPRVWFESIAGLTISFVVYANVCSALDRPASLQIGSVKLETLNKLAKSLELKQHWVIFSDFDVAFLGWFRAIGELEDGSTVDVWNETPFTGYEKPPGYAGHFPNHNWRRFWNLIRFDVHQPMRPYLARYLVRHWNETHEKKLAGIVILMIDENGGVSDAQKRYLLIEYRPPRDGKPESIKMPPRVAQGPPPR